MADLVAEGGGSRQKGIHILKPIVYGNVSKYFGKKREEDGHTHQWTVYVKPFRNEDMSAYVKKVNFKLHDSYANNNRTVTKPPYEVTETGWGEFEIQIKIYLADPVERPVTIYHVLKLFQTGTGPSTDPSALKGGKSVVSEFYDEIIFQDPTQYIQVHSYITQTSPDQYCSITLQPLLTTTRQLTMGAHKHETDFEEKKKATSIAIKNGRVRIQAEIADMKSKLDLAKRTTLKFREEIKKAQKEKGVEQ